VIRIETIGVVEIGLDGTMSQKNRINSIVRQRIRELRLGRKIKLREIAAEAGIPLSSYACMESGHYNLSLDHLFRILGVLEADIRDVWPAETAAVEGPADRLYLMRIQSFRLGELVTLSQADGGALFSVREGHCDIVMYESLSDFLLDRLMLYLEDGRHYPHGMWFERTVENARFCFFLKSDRCPDFVKSMIRRYLVIWSHLFQK